MALPNFFRSDQWVKTTQGLAVSGAHVYWLSQPATIPTAEGSGPVPLATIYTDSTGMTTMAQPVQTDSFGHADAYMAPNLYTIAVYNNGTLQLVLTDQSVGAAGLVNANGLVAGVGISIAGNTISGAYVAGTGITIVNGVITNTSPGSTFTAGSGISIVGTVVSNTAQSATVSTPGQGWFMAAGSLDTATVVGAFNAQLTNRGANVVVVCQFVLGESFSLSKVSYALQTAVAASHFNFGIYDKNGNKLIDSGPFDGSITTAQVLSFTTTVLAPGVYYFAVSETSGGTLAGPITQYASPVLAKWLGYFTLTTPFIGTAANATSGNVMPATLGAITAASAAWLQGLPLCVWQV